MAATEQDLVSTVSGHGGVWLFKVAGSVARPPLGCRTASGGKEVMCYEDHGRTSRGNHLYQPCQVISVGLGQRSTPAAEKQGVWRCLPAGSRPRPVTRSSAGFSGSQGVTHTCPCAQLWSWLPQEGRHALAKSAKDTRPQRAVCASQELWAKHASGWLSSSSEKQLGLRRAPASGPSCLLVPSGCSFLCRPLKYSKTLEGWILVIEARTREDGPDLEQERE